MMSKKALSLAPRMGRYLVATPLPFKSYESTSMFLVHSPAYNYYTARTLTSKTVGPALEITTHSNKKISVPEDGSFCLNIQEDRPLTVLLVWLMSQKKHIHKYAKFYLDLGFDVLTVRCTPWQVMWPLTGSQVVARDLLSFLYQNPNYSKTLVHGFSVGCYLWGEVLELMSQDLIKYSATIKRIGAQVWDSPVDYNEIPIGVPKSVFPTNEFLRKSLERYVIFHMKSYQETATKHHLKATEQFYNNMITAPAMFLFSLNDPMVNLKSVERARDMWQAKGTVVNLRAWDKPPHVGILQQHPQEYQDEIRKFLEKHTSFLSETTKIKQPLRQ